MSYLSCRVTFAVMCIPDNRLMAWKKIVWFETRRDETIDGKYLLLAIGVYVDGSSLRYDL